VFYILDMKLAAPPGDPMCSSDWAEFSTAHAQGAKSKLCDWSPHVPVYTASDHVTLAFHSDSTMEARGFWVKYVGKAQIPLGSTQLDSTRLDTFDFVEPVERVETSVSSETSRAVPTWRTTNKL